MCCHHLSLESVKVEGTLYCTKTGFITASVPSTSCIQHSSVKEGLVLYESLVLPQTQPLRQKASCWEQVRLSANIKRGFLSERKCALMLSLGKPCWFSFTSAFQSGRLKVSLQSVNTLQPRSPPALRVESAGLVFLKCFVYILNVYLISSEEHLSDRVVICGGSNQWTFQNTAHSEQES